MEIQVRLGQSLDLRKRNLYITLVHAVNHQNPVRRNFRTCDLNPQKRSDGQLYNFTFLDTQCTADLGLTFPSQI